VSFEHEQPQRGIQPEVETSSQAVAPDLCRELRVRDRWLLPRLVAPRRALR